MSSSQFLLYVYRSKRLFKCIFFFLFFFFFGLPNNHPYKYFKSDDHSIYQKIKQKNNLVTLVSERTDLKILWDFFFISSFRSFKWYVIGSHFCFLDDFHSYSHWKLEKVIIIEMILCELNQMVFFLLKKRRKKNRRKEHHENEMKLTKRNDYIKLHNITWLIILNSIAVLFLLFNSIFFLLKFWILMSVD